MWIKYQELSICNRLKINCFKNRKLLTIGYYLRKYF